MKKESELLLSTIEKSKKKFIFLSQINRIIEGEPISKSEMETKIHQLTTILKQILDDNTTYQSQCNQSKKQLQNLHEELLLKNKIIQNYRLQILTNKAQFLELHQTHRKIKLGFEAFRQESHGKIEVKEFQKTIQQNKVASMQEQVKYLLGKNDRVNKQKDKKESKENRIKPKSKKITIQRKRCESALKSTKRQFASIF